MLNIAIIGTGPTAIYTAKYLVEKNAAMSVTMFESQSEAGKGTPYHQDWNDDSMLSNIASIEIPAVAETLVAWLARQDDYKLAYLGLIREDIDERTFYPRVVLGEYFKDQLKELVSAARSKNIPLIINTDSHVEDVDVVDDQIKITVRGNNKLLNYSTFSHVIMATGHVWPKESEVRPGYFISPWPPAALGNIGQCNVGILGTSLSAIDALVALSTARGSFRNDADGVLHYLPEPGTEEFHATLMSRKGLLPEADFYHTIPYVPLKICTAERIEKLITTNMHDGLLDNAFMLFKAELGAADIGYTEKINLADLTLEEFSNAYFHEREVQDPFEWAEVNLAEAKENQKNGYTVQWRYSILRMHEVIAQIVPYLLAEDHQRFGKYFKPVFVDNYATVPHQSIERLLALHNAGKLDILSIGSDYELDTERVEGGVVLKFDDKEIHFPAFIDATGQRGLSAREFPFPSLWQHGLIKNATVPYAGEEKFKKKPLKVGGIELDLAYHPVSNSPNAYRLYCPSIPFMLGQFPFSQGITSSHDIGKTIADDVVEQGENNLDVVVESFAAQQKYAD